MMKWILLFLLSTNTLWAAEALQVAGQYTQGSVNDRIEAALKAVKDQREPRVWIGFTFTSELQRDIIYIGSKWHKEANRSWRQQLIDAALVSQAQVSDQSVILRVAFSPKGKVLPERRVDFDWLKESEDHHEPLIWLGTLSGEQSFTAIKALRNTGLSPKSQADLVESLMHVDRESVSDYLKRIVKDDRALAVREAALEALAQHNPARVETFLQKQAQSTRDPRLQETAIETLYQFDHAETVAILGNILDSNRRDAAEAAADVLSHLHDPTATRLLEKVVNNHPSSDVRQRALYGLAERPGYWPTLLAKAEKTGDEDLAQTAIHLKGEHYPAEATEYFVKWLNDSRRAELYADIVHAYAEANPAEACSYFEEQIIKHPHPEARMMMLYGLEDCGLESFILLKTVFEKDRSDDVQSTALHRMGEAFPSEAAAFFRELIWNGRNSDFQIVAIHNLLEDLGGVSENELQQILDDHPNDSVRLQVLDVIKDSANNFEILDRARNNSMEEVRFMAWEAMFESDFDRSLKILKGWLKQAQDEDDLHAAFHALMDDEMPEAVAFLMEVVEQHSDSRVRAAAIHHLADADQSEALLDLLSKLVVSDVSLEVRSIAIHTLADLPGKDGKRRLLKIARQEEGDMRQEIIQYLSNFD
jgi:HEAT repeat protein